MLKAVSLVVFCLCCLSAASVLYFSPMFVHTITLDSEGWGSKFFAFLALPVIVPSTGLLAVSAVLYRKRSRRLDLISVYISGITLGVAILAWILVEPLRQWIIFGK